MLICHPDDHPLWLEPLFPVPRRWTAAWRLQSGQHHPPAVLPACMQQSAWTQRSNKSHTLNVGCKDDDHEFGLVFCSDNHSAIIKWISASESDWSQTQVSSRELLLLKRCVK
ncbi:hypothetical protein E1301_Tti009608 [Triplophysa tibetana]|uniref:Uncharacterized protein n=1 Tax=Triplophysa tibetana TaxID=1572043 RepID=A0A5A9ND60_9TELE|nr:hypothetical protein E1301_Tti009608 [Triplophysa tibetana]